MKRVITAAKDGGSRVYDLAQYCWHNEIAGDDALKLICKQLEKEKIEYDKHAVESKMYQYFDELADESDVDFESFEEEW